MKFELSHIFDDGKITVSEFTLEDFRSLCFMVENDCDSSICDFLDSKINGVHNSVDKFNILSNARIRYVSDTITLNNGSSNISIKIKMLVDVFQKNISDIKTTLNIDGFELVLDYPRALWFPSMDDITSETIKSITFMDKVIEFDSLTRSEKNDLVQLLPLSVVSQVKQFIEKHNHPIILLESKLGLPPITINFFDNSAFEFIKTLYDYYNYEDITELLFMLSKRISDISYLNTRTPKDLDLLIRLYEEEVEKINQSDKSLV